MHPRNAAEIPRGDESGIPKKTIALNGNKNHDITKHCARRTKADGKQIVQEKGQAFPKRFQRSMGGGVYRFDLLDPK